MGNFKKMPKRWPTKRKAEPSFWFVFDGDKSVGAKHLAALDAIYQEVEDFAYWRLNRELHARGLDQTVGKTRNGSWEEITNAYHSHRK